MRTTYKYDAKTGLMVPSEPAPPLTCNMLMVNALAGFGAGGGPVRTDPLFSEVTLLLQPKSGDSSIVDYSNSNQSLTVNGVSLSTAQQLWGDNQDMLFERSSGDDIAANQAVWDDLDDADWTIEMFLYPFDDDALNTYMVCVQNSSNRFLWRRNNQQVFIEDGGTELIDTRAGPILTTNAWKHLALVRNGATIEEYYDGVLQQSDTLPSSSTTLPNFSSSLYIGNDHPRSNYFDGYMQSIRVTNGTARYTSNFTPPAKPFPYQ